MSEGPCESCGAPGRVLAHPSAPVSAVWCDACHARLATRRVPMGMILLVAGLIAGLVASAGAWLSGGP